MANCLPEKYKLKFENRSGMYTIISVLGRGASTIAYLTNYVDEAGQVSERIIKEYCPYELEITRGENGKIICAEKDILKFEQGLERFKAGGEYQNELRNKVALKNSIPPMQGVYAANNTLYLEVTPYEGKTLDRLIELSLVQRIKICLTIAKLVNRYHKQGYLCLDIKPENIFILINDGEIVTEQVEYIDFDSMCKIEEVSFEKSLSYTEAWAAPEQINPYSYKKISEATDVYAVGELVFWLVFGRHSSGDEHRGFSRYPFDETETPFVKEFNRNIIKDTFTKFFRKTLRSSVKNRFSSLEEVIAILSVLTDELSKTVYLKDSVVRPNPFFVGREDELNVVEDKLVKNGLVFLRGIGGIGKSEIARNYYESHRNIYQTMQYWTYAGSLIKLIVNDDMVDIHGMRRSYEATDKEYCWEKLRVLKDCLCEKNLIVLDNFNIKIQELSAEEKEVWMFLTKLPCDILVTTQQEQSEFDFPISGLKNVALLRSFFERNGQKYSKMQSECLDNIIKGVGYNTFLVEVIAGYMFNAKKTPEKLQEELLDHGIFGLTKENVDSVKDGINSTNTVMDYVKRMFLLENVSTEQKLLLAKLALSPVTGLSANIFKAYFHIEDYNELNDLLEKGWVSQTDMPEYRLTIHPVVASVALAGLNESTVFCDALMEDILLLSNEVKEGGELTYKDIISIYGSIAYGLQKFEIKSIKVAEYITRYVSWSEPYGNLELRYSMLKYAIELYQKFVPEDEFCKEKEWAHDIYVDICLKRENIAMDEILELCKIHRTLAKNYSEHTWALYWCMNMVKIATLKSWLMIVKYLPFLAWDVVMELLHDNFSAEELAKPFYIRDAEWGEALVEHKRIKSLWAENLFIRIIKMDYKLAKRNKKWNDLMTSELNERISICEAKILRWNQPSKAKILIENILRGYEGYYTINQYEAKSLLGEILFFKENEFHQAKQVFLECIEIEEKLSLPKKKFFSWILEWMEENKDKLEKTIELIKLKESKNNY